LSNLQSDEIINNNNNNNKNKNKTKHLTLANHVEGKVKIESFIHIDETEHRGKQFQKKDNSLRQFARRVDKTFGRWSQR